MSVITQYISRAQRFLRDGLVDSALLASELAWHEARSDSKLSVEERLQAAYVHSQCLQAGRREWEALQVLVRTMQTVNQESLRAELLMTMVREIAGIYFRCKDFDLCGRQLLRIPEESRTVKDWRTLGVCYRELGNLKEASRCYRRVLKLQPDVLEAFSVVNCIKGTSARPAPYLPPGSSKLDIIAKIYESACSEMYRLNYARAIQQLKSILRQHPNNARIVAMVGSCYFHLGQLDNSMVFYTRARAIDPKITENMDKYANLLQILGKSALLQRLAEDLLKHSYDRPEGWVAAARYFQLREAYRDALAMVWKAQTLDKGHSEAYCAEGSLHIQLEQPVEALEAYRRAHTVSRDARTFRGILESYILLSRYKDAFVIAKEAAELMPKNANALTMVGVVLSHSPESYDKAVAILNTALSIDPRCTDAVAALVSLYVSNDKHDEAIALLEGTLPRNNTDAMHTRLADVLTLANQLPRAVVHYNNALTLNPHCQRARLGLERVDRMLHPEHDDGDEVEEADVGDLDEEMDEEDMALNPHEAFFEGEEQQHIEGGDSSSGSAHGYNIYM